MDETILLQILDPFVEIFDVSHTSSRLGSIAVEIAGALVIGSAPLLIEGRSWTSSAPGGLIPCRSSSSCDGQHTEPEWLDLS